MAAFCTSCGTQQSGDAQFCENCGARIVTRAAPASVTPPGTPAPAAQPPAGPETSGKDFPVMLVVGGLVALLVIGGLVAVLFSSGSSSPARTASDFFWALEQGNVEEAKGLMSSQLRAVLNDQKLTMVLAQNRAMAEQRGGLKDIEVVQETITEQTALVRLKLVYADGYTDGQNVKLILEDNDWKISADK